MFRILFAVSEIHPLIKTGGLADVAGSLPFAMAELEQDIRIVLPAYRDVVEKLPELKPIASLRIKSRRVRILEAFLPESAIKVWLVDNPGYFNRSGNPYLDERGIPWPDNAARFALFSRSVCEIAMNRADLNWRPDLVHCNDWQIGLVPALLNKEVLRPATLFTIHNLAYQGLFPHTIFKELKLPKKFWSKNALEFHDQLSFIKGGLVYGDRINTVSPRYSLEIQTPEFGYGLDGLLNFKREILSGILNGIDTETWNPQTDAYLAENYSSESLNRKQKNKITLLERFQLQSDFTGPVIGFIGRLVHQKGVDMILHVIRSLNSYPYKFVLIGSGETDYENALRQCATDFPDRISVKIGYDESIAHLVEAGSDIFLMPSRFEPCGLNQMYSLRYGTIPIVRNTGGLSDTVVDTNPVTLKNDSATGIVFDEANSGSLLEAVKRALLLYDNPGAWRKMQSTGMQQDFSWKHSAEQYLELYREACETLDHSTKI